ncbi:MAG: hypothetical protein ABSF45_28085 [Terriglobia bacterium]|jgi:hypothetical protein
MSNPFNVLQPWKPGDTREVPERTLKQVRLEGKYDSYSQIYKLDGRQWKIQGQLSHPSGDTIYTLVCVNEV